MRGKMSGVGVEEEERGRSWLGRLGRRKRFVGNRKSKRQLHTFWISIAVHAPLNPPSILFELNIVQSCDLSKPSLLAMCATAAPLSSITEDELAQLERLKPLIEDMWEVGSTAKGSAEAKKHTDDGTLLRFIAARPTIEEAASMFRESMAWREEVGIDGIWHSRQTEGGAKNLSEIAKIAQTAFYGLVLSDADGHTKEVRLSKFAKRAPPAFFLTTPISPSRTTRSSRCRAAPSCMRGSGRLTWLVLPPMRTSLRRLC